VVTAAAGRRPDRRIRCVISRVSAAAAHRPLAEANGCLLTGRVRNDTGCATGRQNSLVTSRITSPIPYRPLNNEAWSRQPTGEAETSYGRLRFATVTVYGGYRPAAPVRVG
jgi:hypothetical protein